MAATDLVLPPLRQAWDALPDVPLIPNYGEDLVVWGKKVEIAHYSKYNSLDILEALQTLIPSKHSLVLIPSFGGTSLHPSNDQGSSQKLSLPFIQNGVFNYH